VKAASATVIKTSRSKISYVELCNCFDIATEDALFFHFWKRIDKDSKGTLPYEDVLACLCTLELSNASEKLIVGYRVFDQYDSDVLRMEDMPFLVRDPQGISDFENKYVYQLFTKLGLDSNNTAPLTLREFLAIANASPESFAPVFEFADKIIKSREKFLGELSEGSLVRAQSSDGLFPLIQYTPLAATLSNSDGSPLSLRRLTTSSTDDSSPDMAGNGTGQAALPDFSRMSSSSDESVFRESVWRGSQPLPSPSVDAPSASNTKKAFSGPDLSLPSPMSLPDVPFPSAPQPSPLQVPDRESQTTPFGSQNEMPERTDDDSPRSLVQAEDSPRSSPRTLPPATPVPIRFVDPPTVSRPLANPTLPSTTSLVGAFPAESLPQAKQVKDVLEDTAHTSLDDTTHSISSELYVDTRQTFEDTQRPSKELVTDVEASRRRSSADVDVFDPPPANIQPRRPSENGIYRNAVQLPSANSSPRNHSSKPPSPRSSYNMSSHPTTSFPPIPPSPSDPPPYKSTVFRTSTDFPITTMNRTSPPFGLSGPMSVQSILAPSTNRILTSSPTPSHAPHELPAILLKSPRLRSNDIVPILPPRPFPIFPSSSSGPMRPIAESNAAPSLNLSVSAPSPRYHLDRDTFFPPSRPSVPATPQHHRMSIAPGNPNVPSPDMFASFPPSSATDILHRQAEHNDNTDAASEVGDELDEEELQKPSYQDVMRQHRQQLTSSSSTTSHHSRNETSPARLRSSAPSPTVSAVGGMLASFGVASPADTRGRSPTPMKSFDPYGRSPTPSRALPPIANSTKSSSDRMRAEMNSDIDGGIRRQYRR